MTCRIFLISMALLVSSLAFGFDKSHAHWTEVLHQYQAPDGRIRYKRLKSDFASNKDNPFALYLKELATVSATEFDTWGRENQLAFLINAYNALTIKLILDHYPVVSIRKIGGLFKSPWKMDFFSLLGGTIKNLDTIEHRYLREKYKEPLIHAAINCASFSCPRLRSEAFVGEKISSQLESSFREFLSDSLRNHNDPGSGILHLSEIFKWFGDDFNAKFGGYLKAIEKYGPASAKEALTKGGRVEWIDYDWTLNDADAATK